MIRDTVHCNDSLARRILYSNTTERGLRDYDVHANREQLGWKPSLQTMLEAAHACAIDDVQQILVRTSDGRVFQI